MRNDLAIRPPWTIAPESGSVNLSLDTEGMQSSLPTRPSNHPKWPLGYEGGVIPLLNIAPAFGQILAALGMSSNAAGKESSYLRDSLKFYRWHVRIGPEG